MIKTFSLLFIILFLTSCGKSSGENTKSLMLEITEEQSTSPIAPPQAQTFEIKSKVTGFTRVEEEKIYKAFELIKRVIASDEFKRKVLSKKHSGKTQFFNNNGLSNAQIYKKILEASEVLSPGKNNVMDIEIKAYTTNELVIGYTLPNIKEFYMNKKYLARTSFTSAEVAMNVTHEWLHKLGFEHEFKVSENRKHSVPYSIGYIMRDLTSKM